MIYWVQLYLFVVTFVLGSRDGWNYRIFGRPLGKYINVKEWQRWWHGLGGTDNALHALLAGVIHGLLTSGNENINAIIFSVIKSCIAAVIIRVAFYDPSYNLYAGPDIKITHLGTEADSDKFFTRLFGKDGAIRKAITFLAILIILNYLNHRYG